MKVKTFVQFGYYEKGSFIEGVGSDSVFILDGRNSLSIMRFDAEERIRKLKNVKLYSAFQIRKGTFSSYRNLTPVYKSEATNG